MIAQKTGQRACHVQIRDVAQAAAAQWYEALMGANNDIYRTWKQQNPDCTPRELETRFVARHWHLCIDFARTTLTLMLRQPQISDKMKEQIMDVLEKDQLLRYRTSGTVH